MGAGSVGAGPAGHRWTGDVTASSVERPTVGTQAADGPGRLKKTGQSRSKVLLQENHSFHLLQKATLRGSPVLSVTDVKKLSLDTHFLSSSSSSFELRTSRSRSQLPPPVDVGVSVLRVRLVLGLRSSVVQGQPAIWDISSGRVVLVLPQKFCLDVQDWVLFWLTGVREARRFRRRLVVLLWITPSCQTVISV